ncbi:MAG: L-2-amino-thiazoline-4-carboxylic acid hydrolase, partial [Calditrichaeota bacterium]|nr:L-2-amino-thiazoline-4-carboxylic acid hydrolase [Calditrichota bacterium]
MKSTEKSEPDFEIPCEEKIKMLSRLLLAWDGQWFLKTVQEIGLEKAVEQNARVRTSFAKIEMREMLKRLGLKKAKDLPQAVAIIQKYSELFGGNRIQAEWELRGETEATLRVHRCPALEGAKKAGLARVDQPCVACERLWPTWLSV